MNSNPPTPAKEYPPDLLNIESLDIEAQGIAHRADGKVVFIEGALPYEVVTANVFRKKSIAPWFWPVAPSVAWPWAWA